MAACASALVGAVAMLAAVEEILRIRAFGVGRVEAASL